MSKTMINYIGKGKTFIKVKLLHAARKGNYKQDVINMDIKSKTHHIAGDMTEDEALILANGLIYAIMCKRHREKKLWDAPT